MSEPLDPEREAWMRRLCLAAKNEHYHRVLFRAADVRALTAELDRLRAQLTLAAECESQIALERDRLRAGVELAHSTICATVLGIITGAKVTRETEAEINRVVDALAALLFAKEGT